MLRCDGKYMLLTAIDLSSDIFDASLSRMAFVGLTDAYNASVCLLYHMFEVGRLSELSQAKS